MNIRQSFKTSTFLVAALSILVLAGQPTPLVAGGSLGGLGAGTRTVGGVADGAKSSVGSITGATDGAIGALGSATGNTNSTAGTFTHPGYTSNGHPNLAITAKLKFNLLKAKAGVFVLDKRHQLVRINARIALSHILRAKAKVYVLDPHGNLVRVTGKVALVGIKAKAKIYVLDDHDVLRAKVIVGAGGKKGLKAKLGTRVGTVGAVVNVSLGGKHKPSGNGGNDGNSDGSLNDRGVGAAVAALSGGERRELRRKCPSVLATPASYDPDAVRVCRVLVQLSGI